jgi:hypothetical protein
LIYQINRVAPKIIPLSRAHPQILHETITS